MSIKMRNEHRRWTPFLLVDLAGMPAQICGGGYAMKPDEVLERIVEEWSGQRDVLRKAILPTDGSIVKPGDYLKGKRFVIVCTE
jgi:hypothetical protein